jgi:5'-deoxynucleotidase YfbR-like HD superfamily hydrolase
MKKYIQERLYSSLSLRVENKLIQNRVKECTKRLENLFSSLEQPPEITENTEKMFREIEELVSMNNFGKKKSLMENFKNDVNKLKQNVESAMETFRQLDN